jgi:tetratricopeptide (TPR) repeat protein
MAMSPLPAVFAADTAAADDVFAQADEPEKFRVPTRPPQNLTQAEYFDLAKRYVEVEWPEQALECITMVEKLGPNTRLASKARVLADTRLPRKMPPKEAIILNIKASKGYGGPQVAIKRAEDCISKFPEFEYGYITMAKLNEMQHPEISVANYRRAIKINPHNTWALSRLGDRLLGLNQYKEATAVFREALKYDPDDPFFSGQRLEQMHLYEESASPVEQLKRAVMTVPSLAMLPFALAGRDQMALNTSGFIDHQGKFAFHQLNTIQGRSFSNGRWIDYQRIVDKSGKQVGDAKFYNADDFSEGLAAANHENLWGFLDTSGKFCIEPAYRDARSFHNGLAPVRKGGLWGFINKSGQTVIPFKFASVLPFSDGLAAVAIDGKIGYIDGTGKIVIKPQYDAGQSFSEGRATVTICETEIRRHHNYCIDKTGRVVYDMTKVWQEISNSKEFPSAGGFSILPTNDLLAAEDAQSSKKGRPTNSHLMVNFQLANTHPNFSNSPLDNPGLYSEGLVVITCDGKRGYLDKDGRLAIPCKFGLAFPFKEGLAVVSLDAVPPVGAVHPQPMKFGYIDKTGKFIIPPRYVKANSFHEGLASVRGEKGDGGFLDHTGKLILPVSGGVAGDFHDGLAAVGQELLYP